MTSAADSHVYISYVEENDAWRLLYDRLLQKLPLQSIKWSNREGVQVDVHTDISPKFVTEDQLEKINLKPSIPLANLHLEPYCRLFVVNCDDYDIYKNTIKPKILKWMKPELEWLIIHVSHREPSFFQRSVYSAIKSDFSPSTPLRVLPLKLDGHDKAAQEESLSEIVSKLRDSIARSGQRMLDEYGKRIRKLESEKQTFGWNFCTFFATKEGLAMAYETLNMTEQALALYDELEELFYSLRTGGTESSTVMTFQDFGGSESGDDIAAVLDFRKKNYRERICLNKIAEFDFRQYLFARQSHLLFLLCRPLEVAQRSQRFVESTLRALMDKKFTIEYTQRWSFTAYVDVADACKANVSMAGITLRLDAQKLKLLQFMIGDLYFGSLAIMKDIGAQKNLISPPSTTTGFIFSAQAFHPGEYSAIHDFPERYELATSAKVANAISQLQSAASTTPVRQTGGPRRLRQHASKRSNDLIETVNLQDDASLGAGQLVLPQRSLTPTKSSSSRSIRHRRQLSEDVSKHIKAAAAITPSAPGSPSLEQTGRSKIAGVKLNLPPIPAPGMRQPDFTNYSNGGNTNASIHLSLIEDKPSEESQTPRTDAGDLARSRPRGSSQPIERNLASSGGASEDGGGSIVVTDGDADDETTGRTDEFVDEEDDMLDFSDEYESSNLSDANENPPISANLLPVKNIDSALESKQSFDRMFVVLANKAAQSFRSAEKERSVAKVTSSIGQLHFARGRFLEAYEHLRAASQQVLVDNWPPVLFSIHNMLAECCRQIKAWPDLALSLAALLVPAIKSLCAEQTRLYYCSQFAEVAARLEQHVSTFLEPMMEANLTMLNPAHAVKTDEKIKLKLILRSNLALPISAGKIAVRLRNKAGKNTSKEFEVSTSNTQILPGRNEFILEADAIKGKFRLTTLWVELGKVILRKDLTGLKQHQQPIIIETSPATLQLDVLQPECLVADSWQLLQIEVDTNEDTMLGATFKIKATGPDGKVEFKDAYEDSISIKNKVTGVSRTETLSVVGGVATLPDCGPEDTLAFAVPVRAIPEASSLVQDQLTPSVTSPVPLQAPGALAYGNLAASVFGSALDIQNNRQHIHEISVELLYRKASKEKKLINQVMDLIFVVPFRFCHKVIPCSTSKAFLSVTVMNDSPSAWEILDYSFELDSPGYQITNDPNAIIKKTVLAKDETLSMLLDIAVVENFQGAGVPLAPCPVKLKIVANTPNATDASLAKPLPAIESVYCATFHIPQVLYAARVEFPESVRVGEPLPVTICLSPTEAGKALLGTIAMPTYTISVSRRSLMKNSAVYASVQLDEDTWSLIGPRRVMIDTKNLSDLEVKIQLVPLRTGYVRLPSIRLDQISFSGTIVQSFDQYSVKCTYQHEQLLVSPPPHMVAWGTRARGLPPQSMLSFPVDPLNKKM